MKPGAVERYDFDHFTFAARRIAKGSRLRLVDRADQFAVVAEELQHRRRRREGVRQGRDEGDGDAVSRRRASERAVRADRGDELG